MKINIIDTTLREGKQSLFFNEINDIEDKYLRHINDLGIQNIEYKIPSFTEVELLKYKKLTNKFRALTFYNHIYLTKNNIFSVIKNEDIQNISTFIPFPISKKSLNLVNFLALNTKKPLRISLEKAPSIPNKYLFNFFDISNKYKNIKILGFSDTLGEFEPATIKPFVNLINKNLKNKNIEFHLHNDFGISAANALTIIEEFDFKKNNLYFSVSMEGVGERNGILSYGDIFSILIKLKLKHNYKLKSYSRIQKLFDKKQIFFNRDPLNPKSFYHLASSHILGNIDNSRYESINPKTLGLFPRYLINNMTDKKAYKFIYQKFIDNTQNINIDPVKMGAMKLIRRKKRKYVYLDEMIIFLKSGKKRGNFNE